jgi:hypothetical protein
LEHKVAVPIVGTLDCFDVPEIGKSRLEMSDPLPETVGRALPQICHNPREIGAIRSESRPLPWWAGSADKQTVQDELLDA